MDSGYTDDQTIVWSHEFNGIIDENTNLNNNSNIWSTPEAARCMSGWIINSFEPYLTGELDQATLFTFLNDNTFNVLHLLYCTWNLYVALCKPNVLHKIFKKRFFFLSWQKMLFSPKFWRCIIDEKGGHFLEISK